MRECAIAVLLAASCATPKQPWCPTGSELPRDAPVFDFYVHGIRVLVKVIPNEPLVACELFVAGGVRNWTAETAGIERLALSTAVAGGTERLPRAVFRARLAELGTSLGTESDEDASEIGFKSLVRSFPGAFALLADAFLHPALPEDELEQQRRLMLSDLAQEDEDPDAALLKAVQAALYAGTPYARRAAGTPESVAKLDRAALERHLAQLREQSRLLLVVVGDVAPAAVGQLVEHALGTLPPGSFKPEPVAPPRFGAARATLIDRDLPTHYVMAAFPAPTYGAPDVAAGVVAMGSLRDALFEEVRTKRELSYAPSAGLDLSGVGEGNLYVSAVDVARTVKVMADVLHGYQSGQLAAARLEADKRLFLTSFLLQAESTSGQAELLARAQLIGGDWRLGRDLPERVKAVTAAQVTAFLSTYAKNMQTVVLGRTAGLDAKMFERF